MRTGVVMPVAALVVGLIGCGSQTTSQPTTGDDRRVRSAPPLWRTVPALVACARVLLVAMHATGEAFAHEASSWLNFGVLVLA